MRMFVEAFSSIAVPEEDRPDENDMVMWRLTRLPFGVNFSPFVMCAVLPYHLEQATQAASEESMKALLSLLQDTISVVYVPKRRPRALNKWGSPLLNQLAWIYVNGIPILRP